MKKEAKALAERAVNSLLLAIEHFNRPVDRGRAEAVLIFLNHSFEMVLKAALLHKGGSIRDRGAAQTIGFDACIRRALTTAKIKFLNEEQALTLQSINGLRDAAEHHIVDVSEGQLYVVAQSAVTLFREIFESVLGRQLKDELPERVLPVSTRPPTDLVALFDGEMQEVKRLLAPGTRRRIDARAKLRGLAILEGAVTGRNLQPSPSQLDKLGDQISKGADWKIVFPGVASLKLTTDVVGPAIQLRITKKEGVPVQLVKEGDDGGAVVAIKRVNELDYYSLGLADLAKHLKLSAPKTLAIVQELKIQNSDEYFKQLKIGSQVHKRYSQKALNLIREKLPDIDLEDVWAKRKPAGKKKAVA